MHLRPGAVASMIKKCGERQTHIPCHETMTPHEDHDEDDPEEDEGTAWADGPICRWFYEKHGHLSQLIRTMERIPGGVTFIDPPESSPQQENNNAGT